MDRRMSCDESLRCVSVDYLNLLTNGEALSDVSFSVEGRLVHAHRCILAARSLFFRKLFCGPPSGQLGRQQVIPVCSVGYRVFMLLLQFIYSGQVSFPHRSGASSAVDVDLALDTLSAATSFGIDQLALLTQKQLASMVEKASLEDVLKVLLVASSRKQEMRSLWSACSHLVAQSGLPPDILAKHLPMGVVSKIGELRLKVASSGRCIQADHHHLAVANEQLDDHRIRRMRRALDASDVELVKLMVMGEGLNLDDALALHYAVQNCTREVVKALLELGAAEVNCPARPSGKTPLHLAAEMVSPDMVAVLLDHHADPCVRTVLGVTPLDVLRSLTSDFLFKGAVPGLTHVQPNKLRLCLELVQSAALVMSREAEEEEEGNNNNNNHDASDDNNCSVATPVSTMLYHGVAPGMSDEHNSTTTSSRNLQGARGGLNADSSLVYLNLAGGMMSSTHRRSGDDDPAKTGMPLG